MTSKRQNGIDGLLRAIARLRDDENFIASAYQDWARTNFSLERVAEYLATDINAVVCAGLCRRPKASSPAFARDIEKIAHHAGIQPDFLLSLVREADAVRAFRTGTPANGLLAAARDHPPKADPDGEEH